MSKNDNGEACGNGTDDDRDGSVDETADRAMPRLSFVKAAARAWMALANGQGLKAGVVSFYQRPSQDAAFQEVNVTNLRILKVMVPRKRRLIPRSCEEQTPTKRKGTCQKEAYAS